MKVHFFKYQATGNDFVLVDNREKKFSFTAEQIQKVCHRRFGLGADGIILLENKPGFDFKMIYHNADGSESFCGNGCRAIVHFAKTIGIISTTANFEAYDGPHHAEILLNGWIKISLHDVSLIEKKSEEDYFANTGTEHNVRFVKNLAAFPVVEEGRKVRYSQLYQPRGTNADFVEVHEDKSVSFRIYERGVEDETYSSGSGATACALVVAKKIGLPSPIKLKAPGGELVVDFDLKDGVFQNIHFSGPAVNVFDTVVEV